MKRSDAIASLARDHDQELVIAQRLLRANAQTGSAARDAFLDYRTHAAPRAFRIEEELLFRPTPHTGIRTIHWCSRRWAITLSSAGAHVRWEQRELFPSIESVMPGRICSPPRGHSSMASAPGASCAHHWHRHAEPARGVVVCSSARSRFAAGSRGRARTSGRRSRRSKPACAVKMTARWRLRGRAAYG